MVNKIDEAVKADIDYDGDEKDRARDKAKHNVTITKANKGESDSHIVSGKKADVRKFLVHHYGDENEAKENHPHVFKEGVDAPGSHVPGPVGGKVTPPGGDKPGETGLVMTSPTSVNPASRSAMVAAIVNSVSKMKKGDLTATYAKVMGLPAGEASAPLQGSSKIAQPPKVTSEDLDIADDVRAIFEGAEVSEEFKTKVSDIFQSALVTKINEKLEEMAAIHEAEIAETVENQMGSIVEELDSYLDHVVEQWMDENRLAVETGLRSEIVDSFMTGLRGLFAEHYIDVPEGKEDIVENLAAQVEELTNALNKEIEKSVELRTENEELIRGALLSEAVDGLTEVQAEKLRKLAESVEFNDAETFAEKLGALKEGYFPTGRKAAVKSVLTESALDADPIENVDDKASGPMAQYVAAISRTVKKA